MSTPKRPAVRLLVVDDDETIREMLTRHFQHHGMSVSAFESGPEVLSRPSGIRWDVALLDLHMPKMSGIELLQELKTRQPDLEILMLTAHGSIETATQAMKAGAYDYLTKPFRLPDLDVHVQKAYEKVQLTRRERQWVQQVQFESPRYRLVGSSATMQRVVQLIEKVAPTEATVLIRGASGTGKELVARAIHFNSQRHDRPLVTINCATLQESLLESELFGHERGAFTDAKAPKPGLIEVAEGGTLFIDEVAEMSPALQAKLLRVLEDGHFRRVGGTHELQADVRIVAATNRPLPEEMKAGRFREDLFYRLNVLTIELPLLRDRRGDIRELVEHLLQTRRVGKTICTIHPEALEALQRYDWPGNVRELANLLERAQILAEENVIDLDDLPDVVAASRPTPSPEQTGDPRHLREVERRHVVQVLTEERFNKVQAARVLGISRRALYRLIEKYHLEVMDHETKA